jgi:hypothetical protein
MSPNPAPVPCECGFFNKDRYHSKLGGGECSHYRSKVLMAGTSSRNPPVWEITPFPTDGKCPRSAGGDQVNDGG